MRAKMARARVLFMKDFNDFLLIFINGEFERDLKSIESCKYCEIKLIKEFI